MFTLDPGSECFLPPNSPVWSHLVPVNAVLVAEFQQDPSPRVGDPTCLDHLQSPALCVHAPEGGRKGQSIAA